MINENGKKLLTLDEIAKVLQVSSSTIYRWRDKHGMPFRQLFDCGPLYFDEDLVMAWRWKQRSTAQMSAD